VSLSSKESAGIGRFLLAIPRPSPGVLAAVHALADWFKATRITDHSYEGYVYSAKPGAPPLWPRLAEIGTNRPIFSNRDGKVLYDWNELTDRRAGYGWFSDAPAAFLTRYERWARSHPRP
jgi:PelA/Pel-15E family pectate lyase